MNLPRPVVPESVAALLRAGTRELAGCTASPRLDAELLLAHALGLPRTALYREPYAAVAGPEQERFLSLLAARRARRPVAQLTGVREFWSLPLRVTPDTLIPRPETERLVEQALHRARTEGLGRILDLGTGGGAIALALASELPEARITAVDASEAALAVARDNAQRLGLERIEWRHASWYAGLAGQQFELIVSNPPYIADDEWPGTDPELAWEPAEALRAGTDGLAALRQIVAGAQAHLAPDGWLLVEHGAAQGPAVRALLHAAGLEDIATVQDLAGRPRLSEGRQAR